MDRVTVVRQHIAGHGRHGDSLFEKRIGLSQSSWTGVGVGDVALPVAPGNIVEAGALFIDFAKRDPECNRMTRFNREYRCVLMGRSWSANSGNDVEKLHVLCLDLTAQ